MTCFVASNIATTASIVDDLRVLVGEGILQTGRHSAAACRAFSAASAVEFLVACRQRNSQ